MKKNIVEIPKVELHLHLDGSVRIDTACELIGRDVKSEMFVSPDNKDLNEYLEKFEIPLKIMQNKSNITRISYELAQDLKNENVIYAEIRFAPLQHLNGGLAKEEVVEAVLEGLKKVDLKTNLILCMMRNASFEENKQVIELAKKYLNKGVCAIDLAGAEALYKTEDFRDLFQLATMEGIPFTIHAGEADGIESINSALDFGTQRLGHGVRCIESDDLIERIKKNNITLEVCPTSNLNTCIVDSYSKHPIKTLIDRGIKVTINTDNRTVSNVTLSEEYERLIKYHNFTLEIFKECNINAVNSSFLTKEEKKDLLMELNDKMDEA